MKTALQKAKEDYPNATPDAKFIYESLFGKDKFVVKTNRPQTFEAAFPIFKKLKFKDKDLLILQRRVAKDLTAADRLQICAEVWRSVLQFKPDYNDGTQKKWFGVFEHKGNVSGFVFSYAYYESRYSRASGGARFAMPTPELAEEFSKTFITDFNQFLTIKY